jgi:aspartate/methionine/tyrosine aminotransferase
MVASLLAVTNPGGEVVIFKPFYENYGPTPFWLALFPAMSR